MPYNVTELKFLARDTAVENDMAGCVPVELLNVSMESVYRVEMRVQVAERFAFFPGETRQWYWLTAPVGPFKVRLTCDGRPPVIRDWDRHGGNEFSFPREGAPRMTFCGRETTANSAHARSRKEVDPWFQSSGILDVQVKKLKRRNPRGPNENRDGVYYPKDRSDRYDLFAVWEYFFQERPFGLSMPELDVLSRIILSMKNEKRVPSVPSLSVLAKMMQQTERTIQRNYRALQQKIPLWLLNGVVLSPWLRADERIAILDELQRLYRARPASELADVRDIIAKTALFFDPQRGLQSRRE